MTNEIEAVLGGIDFPSFEMEVDVGVDTKEQGVIENPTYKDLPQADSDQLLAEGVAELKDHPQLESFLRRLNDLKNDTELKVKEVSREFELQGSVKLIFSVREKA